MKTLFLFIIVILSGQLNAQDFDYVFVFLNQNPNKEELPEQEVAELIDEHLQNMELLVNEGKLINAGPFEGGGGIMVMKSTSLDSVSLWLQADPAIKANRWIVEMYRFFTTEGGTCITEAPYEMVNYPFIRYTPSNEIANFKSNANSGSDGSIKDVISALKKKNVLAMAGYFGSSNGGVLVLKDKESIDIIKSSSAYSSGINSFQFKDLWIAQGSFCE